MKDKSFTVEPGSIAWKFAGSIQGTLEIDCDNKGVSNGSVAWMDCKPWKENDAGDHVLFIDEVQELYCEDLEALTFYRGKMGGSIWALKRAKNILIELNQGNRKSGLVEELLRIFIMSQFLNSQF
ncbi:flavin reductase family protein [Peribacillus simplex]|uniref:flavin reductase family protein n=1 Tax=Peribacillus simplex TaxID=1478 RepID=UPI00333B72D6